MKIVILLFVCVVFLYFTSAVYRIAPRRGGPRTAEAGTSGILGGHSRRIRAYVHMPDDRIFSEFAIEGSMPSWVTHPNQPSHSQYNFYAKIGDAPGIVATLVKFEHFSDPCAPKKPRCYLTLIESPPVAVGTLELWAGGNPETTPSTMLAFVRMPDDNTVCMAVLDVAYTNLPTWMGL